MKLRVLLENSDLTKFKKYLFGVRASKGLAILTAENPKAKEQSTKENKASMKEMKEYLISKKLGFIDVKGFYGQKENSIIITNISRSEAKKLGEKYGQDSIISITVEKSNTEMAIFEMIKVNPNSLWLEDDLLVREIFDLSKNEIDEYTIIGGKKFQIPFFNKVSQDKAENAEYIPINKSSHIAKNKGLKGLKA